MPIPAHWNHITQGQRLPSSAIQALSWAYIVVLLSSILLAISASLYLYLISCYLSSDVYVAQLACSSVLLCCLN